MLDRYTIYRRFEAGLTDTRCDDASVFRRLLAPNQSCQHLIANGEPSAPRPVIMLELPDEEEVMDRCNIQV